MNHLYWGEGKGKTTAAMGTALRALAAGWSVLIVQFLKEGPSGEIALLEQLGARIYRANPMKKFVFQMDDGEKAQTLQSQNELLETVGAIDADLIVLDEACSAVSAGVLDDALLKGALARWQEGSEIIMTGHDPLDWMHDWADYDTEMRMHKHPYAKGLNARRGVEF